MSVADTASKHQRSVSLAAVPESHPTVSVSPPVTHIESKSETTSIWMNDESVKEESSDQTRMMMDDSDVLSTDGMAGMDDSMGLLSGDHPSDLLWNADAILSSSGSTTSTDESRLESKKTIRTDYLDAMRQFGIEVSSEDGVTSWLESGTDDADTDSMSTMDDDSRSTVSGTSTTSALSMATIGPEDGQAFAERHRLRKRPPRMAPPPVPMAEKGKTQSLSDLREEQRQRSQMRRESQNRSLISMESPSTSDSPSSDHHSSSLLGSFFRRKSLPAKLYSDLAHSARKAMDDSSVMRRRKSSSKKSSGQGTTERRGGLVLGSSRLVGKKQYRSRKEMDMKYRGTSSAESSQGKAFRRLSAAGIDVDSDESKMVPPPPKKQRPKSMSMDVSVKTKKKGGGDAHRSSIVSTVDAGKAETIALSKPSQRSPPKRAKSLTVIGSDSASDSGIALKKKARRRSSPVITTKDSECMVMIRNREKVHGRLANCRSKSEAIQRLRMSVNKVDERVKCLLQEFVKLKNERAEYFELSELESMKWDNTGNFDLKSMALSYFQHVSLLYQSRIQLCKMHLQCFADKRKQLNNMLNRITDNYESYTLDDVLESVEAALMSASNVRLTDDSMDVKKEKDMLESLVFELKAKYHRLKMDTIRPMTADDRCRMVITLLTQVKDADHNTSISDGLPYFHSTRLGNQAPFEQVLLDPRFTEFAKIFEWRKQSMDKLRSFRKPYEKWRKNGTKRWLATMVKERRKRDESSISVDDELSSLLMKMTDSEKSKRDKWWLSKPKCPMSIPKISRFVKEMTDGLLDACLDTTASSTSSSSSSSSSSEMKESLSDVAYLMILRCLLPRIKKEIIWMILEYDDWMIIEGSKLTKQCSWMRYLTAEQIGIDESLRVTTEKDLWTDAISAFAASKEAITPHDLIVGLIQATHTLQSVCRTLDPSLAMLSSDTLFPCIVYCVLRSGLNRDWLCMFRMTELFFHQDVLHFGQSGFCFSLVKAALIYVLDSKPQHFE